MMFTEYQFLDRFAAARRAGFGAVEFLFPYAESAADVGTAVHQNNLQISVFNLSPGDWDVGDRGLAVCPVSSEQVSGWFSLLNREITGKFLAFGGKSPN